MKPSALRPGDQLRRIGSATVWTFERREARQCVLRAEACRGLNGPGDDGSAVVSDAALASGYERVGAVA